jgi:hypothetical protein
MHYRWAVMGGAARRWVGRGGAAWYGWRSSARGGTAGAMPAGLQRAGCREQQQQQLPRRDAGPPRLSAPHCLSLHRPHPHHPPTTHPQDDRQQRRRQPAARHAAEARRAGGVVRHGAGARGTAQRSAAAQHSAAQHSAAQPPALQALLWRLAGWQAGPPPAAPDTLAGLPCRAAASRCTDSPPPRRPARRCASSTPARSWPRWRARSSRATSRRSGCSWRPLRSTATPWRASRWTGPAARRGGWPAATAAPAYTCGSRRRGAGGARGVEQLLAQWLLAPCCWRAAAGALLLARCCWRAATGALLLARCYRRSAAGALLLAHQARTTGACCAVSGWVPSVDRRRRRVRPSPRAQVAGVWRVQGARGQRGGPAVVAQRGDCLCQLQRGRHGGLLPPGCGPLAPLCRCPRSAAGPAIGAPAPAASRAPARLRRPHPPPPPPPPARCASGTRASAPSQC